METFSNLDYSALDDRKPTRIKTSQITLPAMNILLGSLIVGGIILIMVIGAFGLDNGTENLILLPILGAISWFIYKHVYQSTDHAIRLSNFAATNKLAYSWGYLPNVGFKGILGQGKGKYPITSLIEGWIQGNRFRFYHLARLTTRGMYSIFEVELDQSYPHILLDSRSNSKLGVEIKKGLGENSLKRVEHEFERHFDVYSDVDNTLTLQVVEPSLMQSMLDDSLNLDMELVDDKLYLIVKFDYYNPTRMRYIFNAVEQILNNLDAAPLDSPKHLRS